MGGVLWEPAHGTQVLQPGLRLGSQAWEFGSVWCGEPRKVLEARQISFLGLGSAFSALPVLSFSSGSWIQMSVTGPGGWGSGVYLLP